MSAHLNLSDLDLSNQLHPRVLFFTLHFQAPCSALRSFSLPSSTPLSPTPFHRTNVNAISARVSMLSARYSRPEASPCHQLFALRVTSPGYPHSEGFPSKALRFDAGSRQNPGSGRKLIHSIPLPFLPGLLASHPSSVPVAWVSLRSLWPIHPQALDQPPWLPRAP